MTIINQCITITIQHSLFWNEHFSETVLERPYDQKVDLTLSLPMLAFFFQKWNYIIPTYLILAFLPVSEDSLLEIAPQGFLLIPWIIALVQSSPTRFRIWLKLCPIPARTNQLKSEGISAIKALAFCFCLDRSPLAFSQQLRMRTVFPVLISLPYKREGSSCLSPTTAMMHSLYIFILKLIGFNSYL